MSAPARAPLCGACAAIVGLVSMAALNVRADEPSVPIKLQTDLAAQVVSYDRNNNGRAGDHQKILVIAKSGDGASGASAKEIARLLGTHADIGGLPHQDTVVNAADAAAALAAIRSESPTVVYFAPGLGPEIPAIARGLEGLSLITIAAVAEDVTAGATVGFDLVSGKPKIWVNLNQSRKQAVAFQASLLKLSRIVP